MAYRVLWGAAVVAHFAYLAYLVFGGFLAWRWTWLFWPHLVAAVWGALIVLNLVPCPLTWVEDWARRRAGMPTLRGGFMDHYVNGVLYPLRYEAAVRVLVVVVVLISWVGAYAHWRRAA